MDDYDVLFPVGGTAIGDASLLDKMDEIDLMVRTAFTKRHQANNLEKEAIQMVENEIDKWNKN